MTLIKSMLGSVIAVAVFPAVVEMSNRVYAIIDCPDCVTPSEQPGWEYLGIGQQEWVLCAEHREPAPKSMSVNQKWLVAGFIVILAALLFRAFI